MADVPDTVARSLLEAMRDQLTSEVGQLRQALTEANERARQLGLLLERSDGARVVVEKLLEVPVVPVAEPAPEPPVIEGAP